ncbi:hypothetical protein BE04_41820 [Sorangium cellulosum]|uniref:Response regulatory domain-containing protein n=2 Tax=Sorangium cellulosum TaxID=56 RepID=A0A150PIN2_SORCE|nr:response regulator [Sorangium cellulosum]AGP38356.1 hypothetical protein SCE1572_30055 [Sorangium cellulosum So0157-2]KYF55476.1 hypothetical protein BE04_41820 [Sorangium cellulosum]
MARILLVDDDASLLEVLALAFEEAGHATLPARDGTAALALVRPIAQVDTTSDRIETAIGAGDRFQAFRG